MNITEAKELIVSLMQKNNVTDYTLKIDNAKRRAGQCNYTKKILSFPRTFLEKATEEQVRLAAIHEIAHILVGPEHKHDKTWRLMCLALGGDGKRCIEMSHADPKYILQCKSCESQMKIFRLSKKIREGYLNDRIICVNCKSDKFDLFRVKQNAEAETA